MHISRPSSAYVSFPSPAHVSRSSSAHVSRPSCLTPSSNCKKSWRLLFWLTSVRQNPVAATIFVKIEALKKTCCGSCAQDSICSKETEQFRLFTPSSSAGSVAWFKISRGKISRRRMNSGKKVKSQSSYGAGANHFHIILMPFREVWVLNYHYPLLISFHQSLRLKTAQFRRLDTRGSPPCGKH